MRALILRSSRGVAWWQRVWDLHSRSRVRVRACTSCKSLGQPGFYSLIWAHKVRFPEGGVFLNKKFFQKKKGSYSEYEWTSCLLGCTQISAIDRFYLVNCNSWSPGWLLFSSLVDYGSLTLVYFTLLNWFQLSSMVVCNNCFYLIRS